MFLKMADAKNHVFRIPYINFSGQFSLLVPENELVKIGFWNYQL